MNHPLDTVVGEEHGATLALVFTMLASIPPEALSAGLDRLSRAEALGPMLDPSAWTDGKLFDNALAMKQAMRKALALRQVLPEVPR